MKVTGQLLLCSHPRLDSTLREVPPARAAADDRRDEAEDEKERGPRGKRERKGGKRVEARAVRLSAAARPSVGGRGWSHARSGVTGASTFATRAMEAPCALLVIE